MELSTTIPTPRANPPKLNTFIDNPNNFIQIIATRVERGIARVMIKVCRREPRKTNTVNPARIVPASPEETTLLTAFWINTDSSVVVTTCIPPVINPDFFNSVMRFLTPSTTAIVFAFGCFWTLTLTAFFPFRVTKILCSSVPSITLATSRR